MFWHDENESDKENWHDAEMKLSVENETQSKKGSGRNGSKKVSTGSNESSSGREEEVRPQSTSAMMKLDDDRCHVEVV